MFISENVTFRELTLFSNFFDIKKTKWRCIYFLRKCHWSILTWSHNTLNFLLQVNLYIFLNMTNYIFLIAQYNKVNYKFIQTFIHSICSCVCTWMAHLWLWQQSIGLDSCVLFPIFPINSNNTSSYGDHYIWSEKIFICNLTSIIDHNSRGSLVKGDSNLRRSALDRTFLPK